MYKTIIQEQSCPYGTFSACMKFHFPSVPPTWSEVQLQFFLLLKEPHTHTYTTQKYTNIHTEEKGCSLKIYAP